MDGSKLLPKILLACPTSMRQSKILNDWIKHLNKLTYPNFDVLLYDNTQDTKSYFNRISKKKVKVKPVIAKYHEWDIKTQHPLQMLSDVREKIRLYFLENKYDYLMFLDQDIFLPEWGLQRLVSYNKDHVGFYVHVFSKGHRKPCILKSGEIIMGKGMEFFSFDEINEYKKFVKKFKSKKLTKQEKNLIPFVIKDLHRPQLFKTYAVGIGCCMIRRNVLEQCQFRTHPSFIWGEDMWYVAEANDKKFEFWVDTNYRPEHRNLEWGPVLRKSNREMNFWIAQGPSEAKDVDFIVRHKKIIDNLEHE